jgi:hypothetical protein
LEALAKLPLELRADAHWADIFYPLVSTSIWSLATLTLAWLAAFRHKNWARWGFAVLLLFYNFLPALISLAYGQYHQLADFLSDVAQLEFVVPALSIAAVVSIFSKGSQAWFAH